MRGHSREEAAGKASLETGAETSAFLVAEADDEVPEVGAAKVDAEETEVPVCSLPANRMRSDSKPEDAGAGSAVAARDESR
jgi:hypothetical protein